MVRITQATLMAVYKKLFAAFGPQKWWPAQTRFEVIIGAILTQNTNWGNVEKALHNLKNSKCLSADAINDLSAKRLAALIKPAGYFNVKAKRLKNFVSFFLNSYGGSLKKMMREDTLMLRKKLLHVNGIGPETADSILLYALDKPIFVVDAYTKRIFNRHGMVTQDADYHTVQEMFMRLLKHDLTLFNEYHALMVTLGKNYCRPRPRCCACALRNFHLRKNVFSLSEE